jgi:hypothetical protein
MPQFDILILNTQSSTFLSLITLFYLINIYFYVLPLNKTEKYRSKIVMKKKTYKAIITQINLKVSKATNYKYQFHLNILKRDYINAI